VFHEAEEPWLLGLERWHPPWDSHGSAGFRVAHFAGFLPHYQYRVRARRRRRPKRGPRRPHGRTAARARARARVVERVLGRRGGGVAACMHAACVSCFSHFFDCVCSFRAAARRARLFLSLSQLPLKYQERVVLLRGAGGELSALGAPGVRWHHTPGHAPSHVVYAHAPSRTLLAGDLADVLLSPQLPELPDGRPVVPGALMLYTLTAFAGADAAAAAASLCRVAYDERTFSYDRVRPYHDATKEGLTRAQLQPLAEEAAHCGGTWPGAADADAAAAAEVAA
jgi:hypothetical protein